MTAAKKRKPGRPPTGIRPDEKLTDYQRMTIRLPDDVRGELDAMAFVLERPQWVVLVDAIRAYGGTGEALTEDERQRVRAAVRAKLRR
jgi:predicted transcriptional regulator